jgi:hypothetical protein
MMLIGCSSSKETCRPLQKEISSARGPKRIYIPEYFIYRRGKYEFVRGHYQWVLFPKTYAKRSLKGYVTNQERSASAR